MTDFDYEHVWTHHLVSRRVPTVHAGPVGFRWVQNGPRQRVVRTRCGTAVMFVKHVDPTDTHPMGVTLLASHARKLGAHFCQLCWPKGKGRK